MGRACWARSHRPERSRRRPPTLSADLCAAGPHADDATAELARTSNATTGTGAGPSPPIRASSRAACTSASWLQPLKQPVSRTASHFAAPDEHLCHPLVGRQAALAAAGEDPTASGCRCLCRGRRILISAARGSENVGSSKPSAEAGSAAMASWLLPSLITLILLPRELARRASSACAASTNSSGVEARTDAGGVVRRVDRVPRVAHAKRPGVAPGVTRSGGVLRTMLDEHQGSTGCDRPGSRARARRRDCCGKASSRCQAATRRARPSEVKILP